MNLANVYNHISKAYELSTDHEVLHNLQVALTEISTHMDKEKERVKKYRSKEYKEKPKEHTHTPSIKGGKCTVCGTVIEPKGEPMGGKTTLPKTEDIKYTLKSESKLDPGVYGAKVTDIATDPMDVALELLDTPLPLVKHDGVMDDLEDNAGPTMDEVDGVLDDLESILSF